MWVRIIGTWMTRFLDKKKGVVARDAIDHVKKWIIEIMEDLMK